MEYSIRSHIFERKVIIFWFCEVPLLSARGNMQNKTKQSLISLELLSNIISYDEISKKKK